MSEKDSQWLIVLRGGIIDTPETELEDLPNRFSNPWEEERQLLPSRMEIVVVDKRRYRERIRGMVDAFGIEEHSPPRKNKWQREDRRRDEYQSQPKHEKKQLQERKVNFCQDVELAAGATGAVLDAEEDKISHLIKAGAGAGVAIGAYEMLRRKESGGSLPARFESPSPSLEQKHHHLHLIEEIIGAYSLGKELLGDKKHHVAHLVGEAIGATGLIQEPRSQENAASSYSRETGKQDKLLSQEEAERLMDEFLATFTYNNS